MIESKLLKHHRFNEAFYHEDYVLWMDLLRGDAKAVGDKDCLVQYRVMKGTRSANKLNAAKHRWRVYRDALGLSVWKSATAFWGYAVAGIRKRCKLNNA